MTERSDMVAGRRFVVALTLVLACGGSAAAASPAIQGASQVASVASISATSSPAATRSVPCPPPAAGPLDGVRLVRLPCLGDPSATVAVGRGSGRPRVVNVWASWCGPCRQEMPMLEQAYRSYGEQVDFIGVDTRDERGAALRFLADNGVTFPQVFDSAAGFALAVGAVGVPYTVVVGSSGAIVYRHIGALTQEGLRTALAQAGVVA